MVHLVKEQFVDIKLKMFCHILNFLYKSGTLIRYQQKLFLNQMDHPVGIIDKHSSDARFHELISRS